MKGKTIYYSTLKESFTVLVHLILYSVLLWFTKDILEGTSSLIQVIYIFALVYLTLIIAWDLFGKYKIKISSNYLKLTKKLLGLGFSWRKIYLDDIVNSQILLDHNSGYTWRILGIRIPVVYPTAMKLEVKGSDFIFYIPDRKTGEILMKEIMKFK